MEPTFFETGAEFRDWLVGHHTSEKELWVGYYKKASGIPSMTWPESVDQALCFGWIDGIRKSVDAVSYKIRFTPRNPKSIWSAVNIKKMALLTQQGLMTPAGLALFDKRIEEKSRIYSHERKTAKLPPEYSKKIQANLKAWEYFSNMPPGYTKTSVHWVISAKREETRLRRLAVLIESCEQGRKIPLLRRKGE
ncbi:MAG: YdeI/OmpD-associated family protein [Bacteroidota bacterium]